MRRSSSVERIFIWSTGLLTLGSGLATLLSVQHPELPSRHSLLRDVFPLEFFHLSRLLTVILGFALVATSLNIWKRKRRAYRAALTMAIVGTAAHIVQGHDWRAAGLSAFLAAMLVVSRRSFTVRSGDEGAGSAVLRVAVVAVVALGYGVLGFWLLDRRQFGIEFTLADSFRRTSRFLLLIGDPQIVPRTHFARFFVHSLYLVTALTAAYTLFSLFRPVLYRYRTRPHEVGLAEAITRRHGRSALDYFKARPDKSFAFSASRRSYLAYRVALGQAVVLGDPVGPEQEVPSLLQDFTTLCRDNDWGVAFHQVSPDFLRAYDALGLRRLKLGDDAIVDLASFNLDGRAAREFRQTVHRIERLGLTFETAEPPLPPEFLAQMKEVSDEWLTIPGRRERGFTVGHFDPADLRSTAAVGARDSEGRLQAFLNLVPSYAPQEATVDLMRRRAKSPNGVVDYLFIKLFVALKERGFARFSLGLAPMSGFQELEAAGAEERAVHAFFRHMDFLFNYAGLRAYKAKFASAWEPRYLIYENIVQLPAVAVAIGRLTELA